MKFIDIIKPRKRSFDLSKSWKGLLNTNPKMYNKYIEIYGFFLQKCIESLNKAFRHFILIQDFKKEDSIAKLQELMERELIASTGLNLERSSMKYVPKKSDFRNKTGFKNEQPKESTVVGGMVSMDAGVAKRAAKRTKIVKKTKSNLSNSKTALRNK